MRKVNHIAEANPGPVPSAWPGRSRRRAWDIKSPFGHRVFPGQSPNCEPWVTRPRPAGWELKPERSTVHFERKLHVLLAGESAQVAPVRDGDVPLGRQDLGGFRWPARGDPIRRVFTGAAGSPDMRR
jgi:hypothetical protein